MEGAHQHGALVAVRNRILSGEELEILTPTGPLASTGPAL